MPANQLITQPRQEVDMEITVTDGDVMPYTYHLRDVFSETVGRISSCKQKGTMFRFRAIYDPIGRTIDINEFRRKYCGGKSAPWVRLYIFDKFPETDFANGGWVIAPHATSGVKKSIIFEYEASRWIEAHKREIDWSAKI